MSEQLPKSQSSEIKIAYNNFIVLIEIPVLLLKSYDLYRNHETVKLLILWKTASWKMLSSFQASKPLLYKNHPS